MSSSVHVDNKGKYILVIGKGHTQRLDGSTLSFQSNGVNRYLFVNVKEIHNSKAKSYEIVPVPLFLGNISKDWSVDND